MAGSSSHLIAGPTDEPLTQFLVQVFIILILVRILGRLLVRIKQPMVVGEIIAGVLLGPSAFGQIPNFSNAIFPTSSLTILQLFANIGLIFFMFFLGLEVEPDLLKQNWKSSIPIAVSSILVPFACGSLLSLWLYDIDETVADFPTFLLFMGTAFAFTAFPVLARILTSARLLTSPAGSQSLACAAIDDLLGWCTLALTLSYSNGGNALNGLYIALIAFGFLLFLYFAIFPLLDYIHSRLMAVNDELNRSFIALIFLLLALAAWFAEILGIHAFFGAFAFGICVPKTGQLINDFAPKIELIIVEFFLPLYFANSGIRTSIGALNTGELWGATFVVIIIASVAKITPVTCISRLISVYYTKRPLPWNACLTMGVLMNTRGLVALIVLNIGLDANILGPKLFSLMIVMALATTFATPPLIYILYEKGYHEAQRVMQDSIKSESTDDNITNTSHSPEHDHPDENSLSVKQYMVHGHHHDNSNNHNNHSSNNLTVITQHNDGPQGLTTRAQSFNGNPITNGTPGIPRQRTMSVTGHGEDSSSGGGGGGGSGVVPLFHEEIFERSISTRQLMLSISQQNAHHAAINSNSHSLTHQPQNVQSHSLHNIHIHTPVEIPEHPSPIAIHTVNIHHQPTNNGDHGHGHNPLFHSASQPLIIHGSPDEVHDPILIQHQQDINSHPDIEISQSITHITYQDPTNQ